MAGIDNRGMGRGRGRGRASNAAQKQPVGRGTAPTQPPVSAWGTPRVDLPMPQPNMNWGNVVASNNPVATPKPQQGSTAKITKKMAAVSIASDRGCGGGGDGGSKPPASGPVSRPATMHWQICSKKGAGRAGRPVRIETNYLALSVDNIKSTAHHYDISIEPDKPKRLLKAVFSEFRRLNYPEIAIAFDGQKNAYAPEVLNLQRPITREIKIVDGETSQTRTFMVAIQEVRDSAIDLSCLKNYQNLRQWDSPMRAIQCIDIILKDGLTNGVQVGRSFFTYPERPFDLGDFYELWTGLFQSTILGRVPYVNVDVAHKAFPTAMPLLDIVQGIYNNLRIDDRQFQSAMRPHAAEALKRHLNGLRIIYEPSGQSASAKSYKFSQLGDTPDRVMFESDGKHVSVLQYFQAKNTPIQYKQLPCIVVGNSTLTLSFPMELCRIAPGQAMMKKCTEMQTRNMIRQAATSTDVRKKKIIDILRKLQPNNSLAIQQFGLRMAADFTQIDARILNPPVLEYGRGETVQVQRGVWRAEGKSFIAPVRMQNWGVLILHDRTQRGAVEAFCRTLLNSSRGTQMLLNDRYCIEELRPRNGRSPADREIDVVMKRIKDNKVDILFCVIPDSGDTYAKVKQSAELRCAVLTQCIRATTVFKKGNDGSTASNILLKVNAKLNGTNHKLQRSPVLDGNCMVIGADVTHPSPDQSNIPSVVGVASSHDPYAFQYNICWRLQDPRTEMIKDFQSIIAEQLEFYKRKNNNKLPTKLLYFRDGVSEGQFQEVLNVELTAMKAACARQSGYSPKITMVIVQKRHHTRFFPGQSRIGDPKNNNVPAGTIVDTDIVHPNETHFYLVSHQSIQGVARPTKYCVLHDDSNINIDDLQALTYNLCHLFARCNRSVSYPAPTYYAHLMAARGRAYIEGQQTDMRKLDQEWQRRSIQTYIVKEHPMFFV